MSDKNEELIAQAIDSAEEVVDSVDGPSEKPRLGSAIPTTPSPR